MLGEVFYWVFNMSITGALTGLCVLAVRAIRRIPRRVTVWLWLLPYLRFVVPVGLNSRYSLMTLISRITTRTVTVWEPMQGVEFSLSNSLMAANSYFPITYKVNLLDGLFRTAGGVGAVIAAAIIIALGIVYFTTMREIKGAEPLRGRIFVSDRVRTPAVYGVFRPRIVIPKGFDGAALGYAEAHERTHIRYADNLWRLMAFAVTALHWFDPFAWLFLKLLLEDIELACDERTVRRLDEAERKEYALALVGAAEPKSVFAASFGGARIRMRVENVLSFKRMTIGSALAFGALAIAVAAALLTNAGG